MANPSLLPAYVTPDDLAQHLGVSERALREKLRELGACRKLGQRMILLEGDVQRLMEAIKPCPSNSNGGQTAHIGRSQELLPEGDFASLRERLTEKPQNGSKRNSKQKRGSVVSMGRGRA